MLRTDVHIKFSRSAISSTPLTIRVCCMFVDTARIIVCPGCNKIGL